MRSAIAIITYRRINVLKETLSGLSKFCSQYPTAIFEDCGQSDGTETFLKGPNPKLLNIRSEMLAEEWDGSHLGPNVKIFLGAVNLGVSGNSNRALKWFEKTGCDHLCLMNDDLHVLGDFVNFYANGHHDLGAGMFCYTPLITESHRWVTVNNRGYRIKLCPRMTGIMISITRPVLERVGYFDVRFPKMGNEHPVPYESLIWMGDYTFKPIGQVSLGDQIIGWTKNPSGWKKLSKGTVTATIQMERPIVQVNFASGRSLLCAPEHTWLNYFRNKNENYEWIPAKKGKTLTRVISPWTSGYNLTSEYCLGYLKGAIAGDGYTSPNQTFHRNTNPAIIERFEQCARRCELSTKRESTWYKSKGVSSDYVTKETSGARELIKVKVFGGKSTHKLLSPFPKNREEWRGWLGAMYDAEGSDNGIGQDRVAHPKVYEKICEGLKLFNFAFDCQRHEIQIHGGYRVITRFRNLTNPVAHYKFNSSLLVTRFKEPDKIIEVIPAGFAKVYCLTTTTGNYIINGYASKNCDWTNRARMARFIDLDGQPQQQLDLEPEKPLLKHQECATSVGGSERLKMEHQSVDVINYVASRYGQEPIYREFYLRLPKLAGGHAGVGIPVDNLGHYKFLDVPA